MTAIWSIGHRREAGNVLSHIIGSGPEAQTLVSSTTRVLKKVSSLSGGTTYSLLLHCPF